VEWLTLYYDLKWMVLFGDLRQGIFYSTLFTFWIVFAGEHFVVSNDFLILNLINVISKVFENLRTKVKPILAQV